MHIICIRSHMDAHTQMHTHMDTHTDDTHTHTHTHTHKHVHTYANIGKIVDIVNKMVTNLATQQMAAEGSLITYSLNNKSNTKLSTISIQYNMNI